MDIRCSHYSLLFDDSTRMLDNWKILGQVLPGVATDTPVYAVVPSRQTLFETIAVCNQAGTATTFRVRISQGGAALNPKQYIFFDLALNSNDTYFAVLNIKLAPLDSVHVESGNGQVSFTACGIEQFI